MAIDLHDEVAALKAGKRLRRTGGDELDEHSRRRELAANAHRVAQILRPRGASREYPQGRQGHNAYPTPPHRRFHGSFP